MKRRLLMACLCICLLFSAFSWTGASADTTNCTPDTGQLFLDKSIARNTDGTYTITLESYVTGSQITTNTVTPCDIVLVLDMSSSMTQSIDSTGTTKATALKTAAKDFVKTIADNAVKNNVSHRIAVVSFNNSEMLNTNGLVDAATNSSSIKSTIDILTNSVGTRSDLGMGMAKSVFENDNVANRNKIVVFFTDGMPTDVYNQCPDESGNHTKEPGASNFSERVANASISYAYELKNTYKANVYTIGLFSGASAAPPTGSYSSSDSLEAKANRYLHYISSNYPNATALGVPGTDGDTSKGMYKVATGAASLSGVFQTIASTVTQTLVELNNTTIVRDVLSKYFEKVPGSKVNVYTRSYKGKDSSNNMLWGDKQEYNAAKVNPQDNQIAKTIEVSNFDFAGNWVGSITDNNYHGAELIVEITVKVIDGFFGGNNIPSNTSESGVYLNGVVKGKFKEPKVNIDAVYGICPASQSIYIGSSGDLSQLVDYAAGFKPDGTNNAFVNIVYTLKDNVGNSLGTHTIKAGESIGKWQWQSGVDTTPEATECNSYVLSCIVKADMPAESESYGDAARDWNSAQLGKDQYPCIYVFVPKLICSDTTVYLGQNTDLNSRVNSTVQWICSQTSAPVPVEAAPKLSYSFSSRNGGTPVVDADTSIYAPLKESVIDVRVFRGAFDITSYALFERSACSECQYNGGSHKGSEDMEELVVHVKTCSLTISKTGWNGEDANQSFIFTVNGPSGSYTVAIQGNGSKTIVGLPIGSYTICENTAWSWRYTPVQVQQTVILGAGAVCTRTTEFVNKRNNPYWLSGDAYGINLFKLKSN